MKHRQVVGYVMASVAVASLVLYVTSWVYVERIQFDGWPFFLCVAVVFISGAISAQVLKPYYKIDRVLQLAKLKPFFSDWEYRSIWVVFTATMAAVFVGASQLFSDGNEARATSQMCAAVMFGSLYTDAMILLRAKFPTHAAARRDDLACTR